MKNILFLFIVFLFGQNGFSQLDVDSVFFYLPSGNKDWWYVQKDVIHVRMVDHGEYGTEDGISLINDVVFLPQSEYQHNEIRFNPNSEMVYRNNKYNELLTSEEVDYVTFAVTKDFESRDDYTGQKFNTINDVIGVRFDDFSISENELQNFIERHALTLIHQPSPNLPEGRWTHFFKIDQKRLYTDVFDACKTIYEEEDGFVHLCFPNIEDLYEFDDCVPVSEMNLWESSNMPNNLWHIRNNGGMVTSNYNTQSGATDADAKICDCWGAGFHGEGVKVAVIDLGGFDYDHPDMEGQFLQGYNTITGTYENSSFWYLVPNADEPNTHAMSVAGIVAAKANNASNLNSLNQTGAVGIAYKSKIIPIMVKTPTSNIDIAIQKAVELGADIITMSFGVNNSNIDYHDTYYPFIEDHAMENGRNGKGTIVVASTGNQNKDIRRWPAAEKNTIGVGATDPNDYRGRGDAETPYFKWSWYDPINDVIFGSNYLTPREEDENLKRYHVVAPGTNIKTIRTKDALSSSPIQGTTSFTGTSASVPVVAGIIALMLEKNPDLTFNEISDILTSTADKVHATAGLQTYNYNEFSFIPGYSKEMFFGRVNCINALLNTPLGLEEHAGTDIKWANLAYINENEIAIFIDSKISNTSNGFDVLIFNSLGQNILNSNVDVGENIHSIDVTHLPKGMYFLHLKDKNRLISKKFKFVH